MGKTFIAAISILGLVAVVQLVAALLFFAPEIYRRIAQGSTPNIAEEAAAPVAPAPSTPAAASDTGRALQAQQLFREAIALERRGDPEGALAVLARADELRPDSPDVLNRIATIFASLGRTEDAAVYWQRIVDLGDSASDFRAQALLQLQIAKRSAPAVQPLEQGPLRDDTGLQPGATLGIVDASLDRSNRGVRSLKLAVKSRPGTEIDVSDVKIHVFFYEEVDGEIAQTMSELRHRWTSEPIDWREDHMEVLNVEYPMPQPAPGDPPRNYHGFMVLVYFQNQLQDFRAVPSRLSELFPPSYHID